MYDKILTDSVYGTRDSVDGRGTLVKSKNKYFIFVLCLLLTNERGEERSYTTSLTVYESPLRSPLRTPVLPKTFLYVGLPR